MSTVTVKPIAVEFVWNDDGTAIKGASITEASFVDGAFWKKEVKHLADSTLKGVKDFQTAFAAQAVKELAETKTEKQAEIKKLKEQHDVAIEQAQKERLAAIQEKQDILNLLGTDPKIAALKKQIAIAQAQAAIDEAVKRKQELLA